MSKESEDKHPLVAKGVKDQPKSKEIKDKSDTDSKVQKKESINGQSKTPIREPAKPRLLSELLQNNSTVLTNQGTLRFVDNTTSDEKLPYYHGLLPREDIRIMLRLPGDYLLRTTEHKVGQERDKCLSVMWHGDLYSYILTPKNGLYTVDPEKGPSFPTIEALVTHYQTKQETFGNIGVMLKTPLHKRPWELQHTDIELYKKLGEGAFGEVYSGFLHRKNKRRRVAIKTLKGGGSKIVTKEKIEEQMKEARLMRPLRHPNVVRFFGVAVLQEPLMIVMELVHGGSLDRYLEHYGEEIDIPERNRMALEASLAIEYLHSKSVIHRDIAARNCLYGNKSVKLSDFGMSRRAPKVQQDPREKVPVPWLAPEVFTEMMYTSATDVWALGILIWEIYNNAQLPYSGWTGAQIKEQVVRNGYRLSLPDWAPQEVKTVFEQTALPANERITAAQVARAFEQLCSSHYATTSTSTLTNPEMEHKKTVQETTETESAKVVRSVYGSKVSKKRRVKKSSKRSTRSKENFSNRKELPQKVKIVDGKSRVAFRPKSLMIAPTRPSDGGLQTRSLMVFAPAISTNILNSLASKKSLKQKSRMSTTSSQVKQLTETKKVELPSNSLLPQPGESKPPASLIVKSKADTTEKTTIEGNKREEAKSKK